jgi:hypothetical protein
MRIRTKISWIRATLVQSIFYGGFFGFFSQHCLICRPLGFYCVGGCWIEPRTVATLALAVRRSNHLARSYPNFGTIFVTTFEVSGGFLKAGTWVSDFTEASRNWILNFLRKKAVQNCENHQRKSTKLDFEELKKIFKILIS